MSHSTYPIIDLTFAAAEDLTAKQYHFVYQSAEGLVKLCSSSSVNPIGVLRNKPALGETAVVRILGVSEVSVADGGVSVDAIIGTDGNGQAVAKTADKDIAAGRCIGASGTTGGNLCTALINCMSKVAMSI